MKYTFQNVDGVLQMTAYDIRTKDDVDTIILGLTGMVPQEWFKEKVHISIDPRSFGSYENNMGNFRVGTNGRSKSSRIECIKEIRSLTGWTLKEAKDFSEGVGTVDPGAFGLSAKEFIGRLEYQGAVIVYHNK